MGLIRWLMSKLDKYLDEAGMQGAVIAHNVMTRFSELSPGLIKSIGTAEKRMPNQAAIIVIHDEEKNLYLATHRKDNKNDWGFPGGKFEPDESALECAIRELEEETPYTAHWKNFDAFDERPDGNTNVHVFIVKHNNLALHIGGCEQNYGWRPMEDLIAEDSSFGEFNKNLLADMTAKDWNKIAGVIQ